MRIIFDYGNDLRCVGLDAAILATSGPHRPAAGSATDQRQAHHVSAQPPTLG